MANDVRAQVKAINDLYRTALMNRKYYAHRLSRYQAWNRALEITIAAGTSSAVAGWGIWKLTSVGGTAWGVLSGVAALAGLLKPILNLSKEIERYSKLHLGYCSLYYDLDLIIFELQLSHTLSAPNWKAFLQHRKRNNDLGLQDELHPNEKLLNRCQDEVLKEIPAGMLWLPKHSLEDQSDSTRKDEGNGKS